jgi:hypothetical protein
VDESTDAGLLCGGDNVSGAAHVDVLKRVLTHFADGADKVNHSPNSAQTAGQRNRVQHIALANLRLKAVRDFPDPTRFRIARQNADRVSRAVKLTKDFPTDKAGRACYEDVHW